ncbi:replication initiator protein [robinz microvirus RP_145]|nr:replication initiator protein [robinz microvirus RP_145]
MKCAYPVTIKGRPFGCGQCLNCRINQRRVWTHRLILEASQHASNAFATITYNPENMPPDRSLDPGHLRNFLKRLRKNLAPQRLRYFAAGEYGERSQDPHYHLALFGTPSCKNGQTRLSRTDKPCCDICTLYTRTWGFGHVFLGELNDQSAAYTCGYVLKKITNKKGEENIAGRHPEFARMSNRPGLGAHVMDEVASTILENRLEDALEDVPSTLRHGKIIYPLGRYLRRRLRQRIGREPNAPQSILDKMEQEVLPLRQAAYATARPGFKELAFREALISSVDGISIRQQHLHRLRNKQGII